MFTYAKRVEADLVGEHRFVNHVAQHVRGSMERSIRGRRHITESVETDRYVRHSHESILSLLAARCSRLAARCGRGSGCGARRSAVGARHQAHV
jgi:hypothetical protein